MENSILSRSNTIKQAATVSATAPILSSVGFHSLYGELSSGKGTTLRRWLIMEADKLGFSGKRLRTVLRLSKSQYRKLMAGGDQVRSLPAGAFARVAEWLQIPIVGALAAAGLTDIDGRKAQINRGKILDFGLDRMARDEYWGSRIPAGIYMAEDNIRESVVRLYQTITGEQLVPETGDWDLILNDIMKMLLKSKEE